MKEKEINPEAGSRVHVSFWYMITKFLREETFFIFSCNDIVTLAWRRLDQYYPKVEDDAFTWQENKNKYSLSGPKLIMLKMDFLISTISSKDSNSCKREKVRNPVTSLSLSLGIPSHSWQKHGAYWKLPNSTRLYRVIQKCLSLYVNHLVHITSSNRSSRNKGTSESLCI